jgi:hypothetical protein
MDYERDFDAMVKEVKALHEQLMAMAPVKRDRLGNCDYPGVYLFTEDGRHMYCGRTKRTLRTWLREHSRPSVKDAPFAFRLARQATGKTEVTYAAGDGRRELLADPDFVRELLRQKQRVAAMDIRYVGVAGPTTQALLEVYTSTVLKTPYNDFNTS